MGKARIEKSIEILAIAHSALLPLINTLIKEESIVAYYRRQGVLLALYSREHDMLLTLPKSSNPFSFFVTFPVIRNDLQPFNVDPCILTSHPSHGIGMRYAYLALPLSTVTILYHDQGYST